MDRLDHSHGGVGVAEGPDSALKKFGMSDGPEPAPRKFGMSDGPESETKDVGMSLVLCSTVDPNPVLLLEPKRVLSLPPRLS